MKKMVIEHRKMLGLTQMQLSKMTGLSQSSISKAESGAPVAVSTAKKIAKVLGVDWTKFYED